MADPWPVGPGQRRGWGSPAPGEPPTPRKWPKMADFPDFPPRGRKSRFPGGGPKIREFCTGPMDIRCSDLSRLGELLNTLENVHFSAPAGPPAGRKWPILTPPQRGVQKGPFSGPSGTPQMGPISGPIWPHPASRAGSGVPAGPGLPRPLGQPRDRWSAPKTRRCVVARPRAQHSASVCACRQ